MKKRFVIILGFFPVLVLGQSLSVQELILKKKESFLLKQYDQKLVNQQYERRLLNLDRLPVVYADANMQRNIIIPTTPVPAIAFDPNAQDGAILPLKFATKWNARAGIQLEWELFNPSTKSKQNELVLNAEKAELELASEEVKWQKEAILAYASVVLATEQYHIAISDSSNYAKILNTIQTRHQEGRVGNSEYITAQQELERKIIMRHEAWAVLQEANVELNKYANLDPIQFLSSDMTEIEKYIEQQVLNSYDVQLLETDKKIVLNQNLDIRRQLLPTLSMNGFYGQQFFSNDLNLVAKDAWYGSSFINLSIKVPISAYFSQGVAFKKVALQEQLVDYQLQELAMNERNDLSIKQIKLLNLKKRLLGLLKIEELAITLEKEQYIKLTAGRILVSDFQRSNSDLLKARQDVWEVKYDLIKEMMQ